MLIFPRPYHRAAMLMALMPGVLQPQAAQADATGWQVTKLSGHAWTTSIDGRQAELLKGAVLPPGTTVVTGERSRVMLVRGLETMVVGPVAVLAVSETPSQGLSTTVLQKGGSITFDVEKRNVQHFSVETPVLAAVVKGTHFTVTVGGRDGKVDVSRGTVQVTALATGQSGNVTAGQHAKIDARGMSVSGAGRRAAVQGRPRAAMVSALSEVMPTTVVTGAELAAVATGAALSADLSAVAGMSDAGSLGMPSSLSSSRAPGGPDSGRSYVGTMNPSQGGGGAAGTGRASTAGVVGSGSAGGVSDAGGTTSAGGAVGTSSGGTSNTGAPGTGGASNAGFGGPSNTGAAGGKSDNGKGNGGTPGNGGVNSSGSGGPSNTGGAGGKSDNGKGNGGTPGNGKGHG